MLFTGIKSSRIKDKVGGDQGTRGLQSGCSGLIDSEAKRPCLPWQKCSVSRVCCLWKLVYLARSGSTFAGKFPATGAKASFLCRHAEQEIEKKKSPQPVAQTVAFSEEKVTNKVISLCLVLNFGSQVENWQFQGQTERKTI